MNGKVYFSNSLSREKEEFIALEAGKAGIYSCGPTVYHDAHIGNMRHVLLADTTKRVLRVAGYDVKHVMNITDVGHLVGDGDDGEDKMEVGKAREGMDAWGVAKKYEESFFVDTKRLNVIRPDVVCHATGHIPEQIAMIKTLEEKGFTYINSDGVYFDTSKYSDYGKMAKLDIEGLEAGSRVGFNDKKNKTDFALWKFSPKDEKRDMEWDSPWGMGFPGWHIECSAMAMKYLGDSFDIHTGGMDLIPVHHSNEIAQSECASGCKPFVKYWLHNEFLNTGDIKMSKSSGEFLTIQSLIDAGYDPLAFRYLCLNTHYRKPLNFSWEIMQNIAKIYQKMKTKILALKENSDDNITLSDLAMKYDADFKSAIYNDMNISLALTTSNLILNDKILSDAEKYSLILSHDLVYGFDFENMDLEVLEIPKNIIELAEKRKAAKDNKEWESSDKYRDQILKLGYIVKDNKDGYEIIKE